VDAPTETLALTTWASWTAGMRVNLERPLKVGDELGGHMVLGHVDGVATIEDITDEVGSKRYILAAPADLMKFVAPKGSVALDGISLTVNEVKANTFGVNIIPHTQAVTSFGTMSSSSRVNMEIDERARYAAR